MDEMLHDDNQQKREARVIRRDKEWLCIPIKQSLSPHLSTGNYILELITLYIYI